MNMNINLKENRMQLEELTGDERTLVVVALPCFSRAWPRCRHRLTLTAT